MLKIFENYTVFILEQISENKKTYFFKANDIAVILDIVNIRSTTQHYDQDEKTLINTTDCKGALQKTLFLSIAGLFRLLYNNKREISNKFRKWTHNIIDDIIFNNSNGNEEKKLQLQEHYKEKEEILLSSFDKKKVVYLIHINNDLYKFGYSNDISSRYRKHKKEIDNDIQLIYCIESRDNIVLEKNLKKYLLGTKFRTTKKFNNKIQTELIRIDNINIIKDVLLELNKNIYDDELKKLEYKNENLKMEIELEKLRALNNKLSEELHEELQSKNTTDELPEELHEELNKELPEKLQEKLSENTTEKPIEKKLTKSQIYCQKNKKAVDKRRKEYREKNKELLKEKSKKYTNDNKEKELKRGKEYREKNREKLLVKSREYYQKNKEAVIKRTTEYKLRKKQSDI